MSNIMKIIIPLLNDTFELKDIQQNSGFIGAYYEDINRPALVDHIFFMYDPKVKGNDVANCLYKMYHANNLYSFKVMTIDDKQYYVYAFTINKTIRNLRDGNIILNPQQKQRVLDFWGHKDTWVTNNILLGTMYDDPGLAVLPEEDYRPEFSLNEKGGTLGLSVSP